jgi:pyrroloquinoline-quinone synthase
MKGTVTHMTPSDVLRDLDKTIRDRSILQHPFYRAWEMGELNREQLATYARVYYPHVKAFPSYLEAVMRHAADPAVRAELEDNLNDELHNPAPHDALWLDFASHMGLDRDAVETATPHAAAEAIVRTFRDLAREGLASGLAALYAYESQQPDVSCSKVAGLRGRYGVDDPAAVAYFEVHESADVRHRQGERDALEACLAAGTPPEVVKRAAERALDAYWGLLDGGCQEVGSPA